MVINLKKVYIFLTKTLICIIIFLILAILSKQSNNYKKIIKYELYENQLSFSKLRNIYNHYLGGFIPLENITPKKDKLVFNEKINYKSIASFHEGAILKVSNHYLVPTQESGVITYIGEKEKYGNVIIIDGQNEIETWYGNICNQSVKLYDYIEKGDYIGETCDENLYIAYSKENKFLNYKDYLP